MRGRCETTMYTGFHKEKVSEVTRRKRHSCFKCVREGLHLRRTFRASILLLFQIDSYRQDAGHYLPRRFRCVFAREIGPACCLRLYLLWNKSRITSPRKSRVTVASMPRPPDHYTHAQFEAVDSDFLGETVRCVHCKLWTGSVKTLNRKKEHLLKCTAYAAWREAGNGQDLAPPVSIYNPPHSRPRRY